MEHREFCMELHREQMRHGRYFLHEHPVYASSWQEEAVQNIIDEEGVVRATCDQCLYGCETEAKELVRKPTTFMTNSTEIARQLEQRCNGRGGDCSRPQGGRHARCRGNGILTPSTKAKARTRAKTEVQWHVSTAWA